MMTMRGYFLCKKIVAISNVYVKCKEIKEESKMIKTIEVKYIDKK